jgi:creatinine amidohydrolase/Fe(II)-dependent formamide hydrolase-like protein
MEYGLAPSSAWNAACPEQYDDTSHVHAGTVSLDDNTKVIVHCTINHKLSNWGFRITAWISGHVGIRGIR